MEDVNVAIGVDEAVEDTIKHLSGIFRKPKLSPKLLRRPPFAYLRAIVAATIASTGQAVGLFTEEELLEEPTKSSKIRFLVKLVAFTSFAMDQRLDVFVSPANIVAGEEPSGTNVLLQWFGRAVRRGLSEETSRTEALEKNKQGAQGPQETNGHIGPTSCEAAVERVLREGEGRLYQRAIRIRSTIRRCQAIVRGKIARRQQDALRDGSESTPSTSDILEVDRQGSASRAPGNVSGSQADEQVEGQTGRQAAEPVGVYPDQQARVGSDDRSFAPDAAVEADGQADGRSDRLRAEDTGSAPAADVEAHSEGFQPPGRSPPLQARAEEVGVGAGGYVAADNADRETDRPQAEAERDAGVRREPVHAKAVKQAASWTHRLDFSLKAPKWSVAALREPELQAAICKEIATLMVGVRPKQVRLREVEAPHVESNGQATEQAGEQASVPEAGSVAAGSKLGFQTTFAHMHGHIDRLPDQLTAQACQRTLGRVFRSNRLKTDCRVLLSCVAKRGSPFNAAPMPVVVLSGGQAGNQAHRSSKPDVPLPGTQADSKARGAADSRARGGKQAGQTTSGAGEALPEEASQEQHAQAQALEQAQELAKVQAEEARRRAEEAGRREAQAQAEDKLRELERMKWEMEQDLKRKLEQVASKEKNLRAKEEAMREKEQRVARTMDSLRRDKERQQMREKQEAEEAERRRKELAREERLLHQQKSALERQERERAAAAAEKARKRREKRLQKEAEAAEDVAPAEQKATQAVDRQADKRQTETQAGSQSGGGDGEDDARSEREESARQLRSMVPVVSLPPNLASRLVEEEDLKSAATSQPRETDALSTDRVAGTEPGAGVGEAAATQAEVGGGQERGAAATRNQHQHQHQHQPQQRRHEAAVASSDAAGREALQPVSSKSGQAGQRVQHQRVGRKTGARGGRDQARSQADASHPAQSSGKQARDSDIKTRSRLAQAYLQGATSHLSDADAGRHADKGRKSDKLTLQRRTRPRKKEHAGNATSGTRKAGGNRRTGTSEDEAASSSAAAAAAAGRRALDMGEGSNFQAWLRDYEQSLSQAYTTASDENMDPAIADDAGEAEVEATGPKPGRLAKDIQRDTSLANPEEIERMYNIDTELEGLDFGDIRTGDEPGPATVDPQTQSQSGSPASSLPGALGLGGAPGTTPGPTSQPAALAAGSGYAAGRKRGRQRNGEVGGLPVPGGAFATPGGLSTGDGLPLCLSTAPPSLPRIDAHIPAYIPPEKYHNQVTLGTQGGVHSTDAQASHTYPDRRPGAGQAPKAKDKLPGKLRRAQGEASEDGDPGGQDLRYEGSSRGERHRTGSEAGLPADQEDARVQQRSRKANSAPVGPEASRKGGKPRESNPRPGSSESTRGTRRKQKGPSKDRKRAPTARKDTACVSTAFGAGDDAGEHAVEQNGPRAAHASEGTSTTTNAPKARKRKTSKSKKHFADLGLAKPDEEFSGAANWINGFDSRFDEAFQKFETLMDC